jgi:hypothetical protein
VRSANPVWLREMRQAARLRRTPFAIATLTALTALVIASVGGIVSNSEPPATVGVGLYHTFFSLAYAVVAWVGPGVAAMTIASERSGRTWEAVLLTGLDPRAIARGKFLASLTYIALYLVALAPVGAVPFLFGGITALEVIAAFVLLGLFSALSIGFGLSVSSALSSPGLAAVVTLPIAVALSISAYTSLGFGLSFVAHDLWPGVVGGAPVWLPTAYVRAPFSWDYLVYLVLLPFGLISLLAWFFFENTVANMRDPNDDRISGLKRWLLVSMPAFTLMSVAVAAVVTSERWVAILVGQSCVGGFVLLCLFLFSGDALEPSVRVLASWERMRGGGVRRLLGPGIVGTMSLLMTLGLGCFALLAIAGVAFERRRGAAWASAEVGAILVVACYASAFLVFLCGLSTWLRSMVQRPVATRLLLLLAAFTAMVGPWLVLAISAAFRTGTRGLVIAAPSPIYAGVMIDALDDAGPDAQVRLIAGATAMAIWAISGLVLHTAGARQVVRLAKEHRILRERMERGEISPELAEGGQSAA